MRKGAIGAGGDDRVKRKTGTTGTNIILKFKKNVLFGKAGFDYGFKIFISG